MSQIGVDSESKRVKLESNLSQIVRNWSKLTLEDFESKNGFFFMFQLERLFENRHRDEDDDRHLLQMAEREE